jgi:hypothetical protein
MGVEAANLVLAVRADYPHQALRRDAFDYFPIGK